MKAQELYDYVVKVAVEYGYADAMRKAQAEDKSAGAPTLETAEEKKASAPIAPQQQ